MNVQQNKYVKEIVKTRHPLDIKAVIFETVCAATIIAGILHIIL
jgi:hypothetical protein